MSLRHKIVLDEDEMPTGVLQRPGRRAPAHDPETKYALGSVLNHVLLLQTIIGEEALLQLARVGETPALLVGCTGGGSNFGGLKFCVPAGEVGGPAPTAGAGRRAGGVPVADQPRRGRSSPRCPARRADLL